MRRGRRSIQGEAGQNRQGADCRQSEKEAESVTIASVALCVFASLLVGGCAPPGYAYSPGEFTPHPIPVQQVIPPSNKSMIPAEVQARIKQYCATATPLYCSEFQTETIEALDQCIRYRSVAYVMPGYRDQGFPPETTYRIYSKNPSMSDELLTHLVKETYATDRTETREVFGQRMYRDCMAANRLPSE